MPSNTAAWIAAKPAPLEVKPAPYTPPGENEIVVKNRAAAVNPVDWILRPVGSLIFPWIRYPFILGSDLAGEVGKGVTRFQVGDRVLGHAEGSAKTRSSAAEGAFQEYTVTLAHMAAPIPDAMPYGNAAVLPLGLSTAACGLFQKNHLAFQYPSATLNPTAKTLLVWGGPTSVGSNAIQLAVAAGYEVITTCSPRNFDYVKRLGASRAFDYGSKTAVADIIAALRDKTIAGALAIGAESAEACVDIVHASHGTKFVSTASTPISFDTLPPHSGMGRVIPLLLRVISSTMSLQVKCRARNICTKSIIGDTLIGNEVSRVIYEDFMPGALAEGRYVAAPESCVVGKGLDSVQAAFDVQRKGVSAKKVVVPL